MMAPDRYQNMPIILGRGVFPHKNMCFIPKYTPYEAHDPTHLTKNTPFLIYIVRTYISSHSIGPANPQESDVMPMQTFGN